MYEASDLRKGLKIEIDGQPWIITEFTFSKPGKGQAIYNCKMRNMITGSTMSKSYRSNDKLDSPQLESKKLQYSYHEGDTYTFLDANYEQVEIPAEALGDGRFFLVSDTEVEALFFNHTLPIEVTLPTFIVKEVVYTEPGVRGDTATNVTKPAKLDTGYELQVPLFINQGDNIKIDTRTGKYADRVQKR